jgi:hypothetical protein
MKVARADGERWHVPRGGTDQRIEPGYQVEMLCGLTVRVDEVLEDADEHIDRWCSYCLRAHAKEKTE